MKKTSWKIFGYQKIQVEMTWNGRKIFTEKNVNPNFIKSLFSTNLKQVTCKISSKTIWTFSCPSKSADYPSILLTGNFYKNELLTQYQGTSTQAMQVQGMQKTEIQGYQNYHITLFLQQTVKCWWSSLFLFVEDFQPQNVLIFYLTQHKKSSFRLRISSVNLTKSLNKILFFVQCNLYDIFLLANTGNYSWR